MRALGLDLGSKRIGVATSDRSGTLASPLTVVQRSGDERRDHQRIKALVEEEEIEVVVVGLPLSMDGSMGPAAKAALAETGRLASVVGVPVEPYDERLTTVTADQALIGRMGAQARRRVIDKVAAAVLLQAWLDHRRLSSPDGGAAPA